MGKGRRIERREKNVGKQRKSGKRKNKQKGKRYDIRMHHVGDGVKLERMAAEWMN